MNLSRKTTTRLTKLVEFMESLPRSANKHFNMALWISHNGAGHTHQLGAYIKPEDLQNCGTTACALGWAATVPSFRKAGLRVEAVAADMHCKGLSNTERAKEFFDLSTDQFIELFAASNYDSTPKQWAARVRKTFGLKRKQSRR